MKAKNCEKFEFNFQTLTDKNYQSILSKLPVTRGLSERGKLNSYLNNEIYKLCKEVILPNLDLYKAPTKRIIRRFQLRQMVIDSKKKKKYTNIELLNIFAKHHKISVTKVAHLYILFKLQEGLKEKH